MFDKRSYKNFPTMYRFRRLNILMTICLCIVLTLLVMSDENGLDISWMFAPKITAQSVLIKCYENTSWNTLESISSINVRKNTSIFFLETKCHKNGINLTPRQACAVESAARLNPTSEVYLMIPSPIHHEPEKAELHIQKLFSYKNVRIVHVNMEEYFNDTPLENWYKEGRLKSSYWPQSHASDILRYTTLWKYGGTYIDLDVVLIKSFEGMTNFAGAESSTDVAAGILSFSFRHKLADLCMSDLRYHFRGYDWGYNGPGVITRSLKKLCGEREVEKMTPKKCGGFTVYKPSMFYPIPWRKWKKYFTEEDTEKVMEKFKDSYAIHVWNKFSMNSNITIGSQQPYGQVASKFCPKVYTSIETVF